jgi:hypothetical protein
MAEPPTEPDAPGPPAAAKPARPSRSQLADLTMIKLPPDATIISVLLQIPPVIDRLLARLPNLFVSSAQLLEISSHLRRLKTQVARMALGDSGPAAIRLLCNSEWQTFSNMIGTIASERENVRTFCNTQLQLLQRTFSRIAAKQAKFADRPQLLENFKALEAALNAVTSAIDKEHSNLQNLLKALSLQFQHADTLLKLLTPIEAELAALKKTNLDLVDMMMQYIANAENGSAQRRGVRQFAQECFNEIGNLLTQAEVQEKREEELGARKPPNPDAPPLPKKPVKKLKKFPAPKHIPVTRSKLFEDRKLISSLPKPKKSMTRSHSAFVFVASPVPATDAPPLI